MGKNVTFAGQSDAKITMTWGELFPPPAPTPHWDLMAGPAGATLKQIAVGSASAVWGARYHWHPLEVGIAAASDGSVWATNPPDSMRVLKWDVQ